MMGKYGPKHVGVSGFYNIIVNLIQLSTFVGVKYSKRIVIHEMEYVKQCILLVYVSCSCTEIRGKCVVNSY